MENARSERRSAGVCDVTIVASSQNNNANKFFDGRSKSRRIYKFLWDFIEFSVTQINHRSTVMACCLGDHHPSSRITVMTVISRVLYAMLARPIIPFSCLIATSKYAGIFEWLCAKESPQRIRKKLNMYDNGAIRVYCFIQYV